MLSDFDLSVQSHSTAPPTFVRPYSPFSVRPTLSFVTPPQRGKSSNNDNLLLITKKYYIYLKKKPNSNQW